MNRYKVTITLDIETTAADSRGEQIQMQGQVCTAFDVSKRVSLFNRGFGATKIVGWTIGMPEKVSLSDYMLARTIKMLCNGPNGSETKGNPYGVKPINDALAYLADKYGITNALDAADILIELYKP